MAARNLPGRNAKICFSTRHETHFDFTNGSRHPIHFQNKLWGTAEHLYQAMKFMDDQPQIAELIRQTNEPQRLAHKYNDNVRRDWGQYHLFAMERVLTLKFSQYPGLKNDLLATGEAQLIQLGSDQYWCATEDGQGRNEFGRVLMRVRDNLSNGGA